MRRTVVVTIAGVMLSLLLVGVGTFVVLRTTTPGKIVSGQAPMAQDALGAIDAWYFTIILYVALPTVLLVGLLVGIFTHQYQWLAAAVATSPIWVVSFGWTLQDALVSTCLALSSIGAAHLARRFLRRRKQSAAG